MKSAHRHDLETNTLAKKLDVWGEKLRPYSSLITGVVVGLLALYVIMSIWSSYRASRDSVAWDEYQMAILDGDGEMRQVQAVAASDENASAVTMQEWAYVVWADRQLRMASEQFLVDKTGAEKRLSAIAAVYEQFASSSYDPEVKNRARLGVARVDELQNKLDDARKHYALVEGALSGVAQARIKDLESKPVQEATAWLATAKAPAPKMPNGAGTPGARPNFTSPPPATDATPPAGDAGQSLEDILGGLNKGANEPGRYGEKPAEGKAEEAKTPAEPAPGAEAPAAEKPAETPAAETPASAETPATTETPAPTAPPAAPTAPPAAPTTPAPQ